MTKAYDAVIIGAGIIGSAIGCGLARRGWRTLNIDRHSTSGQGSTSSSVAIVRTHYATLEGSALAWEGTHCWENWLDHIGAEDPVGMAEFRQTGVLSLKTEGNGHLEKQISVSDELGIPYEEWSVQRITDKLPGWETKKFGPPVLSVHDQFEQHTGPSIEGAVLFPRGGYCNDPRLATHNLQVATEAAGGNFRFNADVTAIQTNQGRVSGLVVNGTESIDCPVIINAAGPHSARISELAGVANKSRITTRVIRHEYVRLPRPKRSGPDEPDFITFDNDIGSYTRPDLGNTILAGSEGTEAEGEITADPDDFDRNLSNKVLEPIYRLAQRMPTLGIPNSPSGIVDLCYFSYYCIPIYDRSYFPCFYLSFFTIFNHFKTSPSFG